ncbi:MAG: UDP-N-acetylmuramate--L-alanine ligase [Bacteroidales bacterium OttesenSCG-928-I14]|jgi:UDP-N-acetylmuramate--alanine ligase|nr:UDP-N-acetylmuramate--L-alanine ligase [Bacteroidales bacterium OttesenSCG-928-I14]
MYNNCDNIYFIGAGGIGMSSLVQYFLINGKNVSGYDKVESVITRKLNNLGALIHYIENVDLIPEFFKNKKNTLVVVTPAIPYNNLEFVYFRKHGFNILKRAQLLGEITKTKKLICVSGSHGKTTISSMIAHFLNESKIGCSAFLGGIPKNFGNNLLLSNKSNLTVIEADEYDYSFHNFSPFMAVISSIDVDHLDVYNTEENYVKSFKNFASLIREDGVLLIEERINITFNNLQKNVKIYRYGRSFDKNSQGNNKPDFYAQNVRIYGKKIQFDFVVPKGIIKNIQMSPPIEINIINGIAALAIGWLNGVTNKELKQSMMSFVGVKRRFDFHIKTDRLILIDDYAHHPYELKSSIISVRALYPDRKLTVIFQPHLYSRTKNFYKEFALSLSLADEVILLPIYPAREKPIRNVSSKMILDLLTISQKQLVQFSELLRFVSKQNVDVVLVVGAGDVELLIEPLKTLLINRYNFCFKA